MRLDNQEVISIHESASLLMGLRLCPLLPRMTQTFNDSDTEVDRRKRGEPTNASLNVPYVHPAREAALSLIIAGLFYRPFDVPLAAGTIHNW